MAMRGAVSVSLRQSWLRPLPWTMYTWTARLTLVSIWYIQTVIAKHKECCPTGATINLDTYQCEKDSKIIDSNEFPECNQLQGFGSLPRAMLSKSQFKLFANYCIGDDNERNSIVVACINETDLVHLPPKATVPRCCPMFHERYRQKCVQSKHHFTSPDFDLKKVLIINLQCKKLHMLEGDVHNHSIRPDGTMYLQKFNKELTQREFCYEIVANVTSAFTCNDNFPAAPFDWMTLLVSIGFLLSITFLVITFATYAFEIKKQNLYGKTLMCHIGSITVAFACLAGLKLTEQKVYIEPIYCSYLIPYLTMFAFHATFFWLNVMSYDIWRTFRSIRSKDSRRHRKSLRFIMYSIYAWGSATILTLLTFVADKVPTVPELIKPAIDYSCWISREDYGLYVFFVGPIAALMTTNTIMYLMTAYKCYQVKKEIRTMQTADKTNKSKFATNKEQFVLSIKLFVVMGLTWTLDVISYLSNDKNSSVRYLWYIPDIINSLYGLIIFIIFAMNNKNMRRVTRRFSTWVQRRTTESEYRSTSLNQTSISTNLMDTTFENPS